MKKYFIQYKPFLVFLGGFFASYVVLTFVYQQYLNCFDENKVDGITRLVSVNTDQILDLFTQNSAIVESDSQPFMKLFYKEQYVARIVEGCNAVSVIILFASFVVAFSGKFRATVIYILGGSLVIYMLNVLRIASLSTLIYYFPDQEPFLHGVLFPLYIYGVVFLLWLIWIRKFSRYAADNSK